MLLQSCKLQNQQPHQGKKPDGAPRTVPRKVGRPRSCVEGSSAEVARGARAIESFARITGTVQLDQRCSREPVAVAQPNDIAPGPNVFIVKT